MLRSLSTAIVNADPAAFWLSVGMCLAAAAAGVYHGFRNLRVGRLVQDTPTARLRSAAQGYVELEGRGELMDGPPVVSPLSGRQCLWWSYRIEKRSGSDGDKWRTVNKGTSDSLFLLRDDTGQCVIDPDGAEVLAATSRRWYGGPQDRSPRRKKWSGDFRYTERLIPLAGPVYAIGWLRTESGATGWDVAGETRELLAEWKRDQPALKTRFDADGDGAISLAEWETAREAARSHIESLRREQATRPGLNVLSRPPDGRPYLIAAAPQQRLARRYRWRTAAGLTAFFLSGGAALYLMASRFT